MDLDLNLEQFSIGVYDPVVKTVKLGSIYMSPAGDVNFAPIRPLSAEQMKELNRVIDKAGKQLRTLQAKVNVTHNR